MASTVTTQTGTADRCVLCDNHAVALAEPPRAGAWEPVCADGEQAAHAMDRRTTPIPPSHPDGHDE